MGPKIFPYLLHIQTEYEKKVNILWNIDSPI